MLSDGFKLFQIVSGDSIFFEVLYMNSFCNVIWTDVKPPLTIAYHLSYYLRAYNVIKQTFYFQN